MFYILYALPVVYRFKNINKLSHLVKAMKAHQVWGVLYWFVASSVWKRYISHIWGKQYVWGFKILGILVYLSFVSVLSLALVLWKAHMARWCIHLGCYDFEQLSDNRLYSCLVLGKLSIVYSHLLGFRFNLSSPRVPLVSGIVLEVWEQSSMVNKLSSSYRTWLVTTCLYT